MKCPLFIMNDVRVQLGEETEIGDCQKEECAWWSKFTEECAVPMLALEINHLRAAIQTIKDLLVKADQSQR